MDLESNNYSYEITSETEGLQFWKQNQELSEELRQDLANANVIFVPAKRYLNTTEKFFEPNAEDLFEYLNKKADGEIKVDICVDEGKYSKLAYFSEPGTLISIGTIIVSSFVLPLVKDLLIGYLREKPKDSETRLNLVVDNNKGFIRKLNYSGPPDKLQEILPSICQNLLDKEKQEENQDKEKSNSSSQE